MSVAVFIPARIGSTRFPRKALADRTGRALVVHVADRVKQMAGVDDVFVASDSEEIGRAVEASGHVHVLTDASHPNGTSRIAQAAGMSGADLIVNVQGDEPEIEASTVRAAIAALTEDRDAVMGTVAAPLTDPALLRDPNVVKVEIDDRGRATAFTREAPEGPGPHHRHVGIYSYRRSFLERYLRLEPTPLEMNRSLEQLRVLEHGFPIAVRIDDASHPGIDTPAQYDAFVARWRARENRD